VRAVVRRGSHYNIENICAHHQLNPDAKPLLSSSSFSHGRHDEEKRNEHNDNNDGDTEKKGARDNMMNYINPILRAFNTATNYLQQNAWHILLLFGVGWFLKTQCMLLLRQKNIYQIKTTVTPLCRPIRVSCVLRYGWMDGCMVVWLYGLLDGTLIFFFFFPHHPSTYFSSKINSH